MDTINGSFLIKLHIQQCMDNCQYYKMLTTLPFQRIYILCQPIEDPTELKDKMGAVETNEGLIMAVS